VGSIPSPRHDTVDEQDGFIRRQGLTFAIATRQLNGEGAMRYFLILGLLVALCNSADAAKRRHHVRSGDVIVHAGRAGITSFVSPGGARIYRDDSVPGGLRTDHDPLPAYNDPSRFGGGYRSF
jgi:hypothetical protein